MGSKKLWCVIVAVLAVGVMVVPSLAHAQAAPKTIQIGIHAAVTGFNSGMETQVRDGALAGIDWLNEKGGITIKGEKYKFVGVVEDNKTTPEGSKAAAEKLVYDHKVKFITGSVIPFINVAMAGVTESAKVIRSVDYSTEAPHEMGKDLPFTFRSNPAIIEGVGTALQYLVEKFPNAKNVVIAIAESGADEALINITDRECNKRGLKRVGAVPYAMDTVDFYPKTTEMLSHKPDVILIGNGGEVATAPLAKALREQGFKGPLVFGNYDDPYEVEKVVGKDYLAPFWTHGWSKDLNDPNLSTEYKEIVRRMEARGGFHQWNLWGWSEVWTLAQAIEKAQSLDTTVVANSWRKMTKIETPYGEGHMCGEKTIGINNVVCSRVAITEVLPGGQVKHIKWIPVDVP